MNIFVLDLDPIKASVYHNDKHVVKMILETAQLLCGVHHMTEEVTEEVPYKLSHKNHPCSIWARECLENYIWLCDLGMALCREYTHRYNKRHKSQAVIEWCYDNLPNLPELGDITPFALAMPDECKTDDPVESYRRYYMMHKQSIANWKMREIPKWYKSELVHG
jgi:hypothetical protein